MSRFDNPSNTGQSSGQGQGGTVDQIKEKASQVAQNLRDTGSQLRDKAQEQMNNLKDSAGEYYQQGRDMASQYYEQGREMATEWEQNLENYVREQPIKSLLIAAGVGCVIGFLWRKS